MSNWLNSALARPPKVKSGAGTMVTTATAASAA
jgi:hypothetical protein